MSYTILDTYTCPNGLILKKDEVYCLKAKVLCLKSRHGLSKDEDFNILLLGFLPDSSGDNILYRIKPSTIECSIKVDQFFQCLPLKKGSYKEEFIKNKWFLNLLSKLIRIEKHIVFRKEV